MKSFCIIIIYLLISSCGKKPTSALNLIPSSIIDGQEVKKNDAVAFSTVKVGTCSGTLISRDLVITAAHCATITKMRNEVSKKPTYTVELRDDIKICFGLKNPCVQGDVIPVKSSDIRLPAKLETYDRSEEYSEDQNENDPIFTLNKFNKKMDMALLKLSAPAPSGFIPVAILDSSSTFPEGTELLVAGFGDRAELKKTYRPFEKREAETGLLLTQRYGEEGVFYGDSGGPAFFEASNEELFLVGSTHGAHSLTNAYFLYIPAFKSFLLNAAKELRATPPVFKMP